MQYNVAALRKRIPKVDPWTAGLALAAAAILVYFGMLGFRYWNASRAVADLNVKARTYTLAAQRQAPDETAASAQAETQTRQLDRIRNLYTYASADEFISVLASTASASGVSLISVSSADPQARTQGGVQFQVQSVSLRLQGMPDNLYSFLASIQEKVQVASISDVRMTSLEGAAAASVTMLLYTSPQQTSATPGKGAK